MGAFLLARFDSGSLVGLIRDGGHPDIRMVTLGFEEFRGRFKDEIPIAEKTARHSGTRNTTQILGNREFQDDWPRIFEAMNQLCTDETNTWLVSKGVREVGLKVSHSGAGGENFLGTSLVPRNSGLDMHNEMAFGHSNGLSLRLSTLGADVHLFQCPRIGVHFWAPLPKRLAAWSISCRRHCVTWLGWTWCLAAISWIVFFSR